MPALVALTGTLMAVLGVLGLSRPHVLIEVTAQLGLLLLYSLS